MILLVFVRDPPFLLALLIIYTERERYEKETKEKVLLQGFLESTTLGGLF